MNLSEKELEDYIFADLVETNGSKLATRGLYLPARECPNKVKWVRQLNIDPYGTPEATEIIKQALKATKLGKRGINLKIEEKRAKK